MSRLKGGGTVNLDVIWGKKISYRRKTRIKVLKHVYKHL